MKLIKIEFLFSVQLISKFNYEDRTESKATTNQIVNAIKRVFRIILSLGYFQVEKYAEFVCQKLNRKFHY
jgi:hypothetical protein